MQSHSINIEKPPKRIKQIKFQTLHSKFDGALELILKQLFLRSPTLFKVVAVMNQTSEGYTFRFWKNIFRPKYIDVVQSVQIYLVYRYDQAFKSSLPRHFFMTLKFLIKLPGVKSCTSLKCFPITECLCSSTC